MTRRAGRRARGSSTCAARDRFAEAHLPGTVSVEYAAQFATYVGWLVPWDDELVLLTDQPARPRPRAARPRRASASRASGRTCSTPAQALPATYRRADWAEFRVSTPGRTVVVVDVRQRDEFEDGHLPGAAPRAGARGRARAATTCPPGELWVHCRSGYRAGIAASLLHRAGRTVVHVDDAWDRVAELAIPTTPGGLAA